MSGRVRESRREEEEAEGEEAREVERCSLHGREVC
jgi:hypothetical protein